MAFARSVAPDTAASTDESPMRPAAEAPWEVLEGTLRMVAGVTLALGYGLLVTLIVVHHNDPQWALYAPPCILVLVAPLTRALPANYRLRAGFLVSMVFLACFITGIVSAWPYASVLYIVPCLLAGVLLSPVEATVAAIAGTTAMIVGPAALPWGEPLLTGLSLLWLSALLVWAAMGGIFFTVRRAESSEARAWHFARESNERRGELARAKKALSDMYGLLERTNYELVVARQEAEEARHIKAQFAANISHELRTPLNLIVGFSEMMYRSPEVYGNVRWTPALSADIREIHRSSRHLLGMIDDILDLSRIEAQRLPLRLESTDVGTLVHEATDTASGLLRGKSVSLEVEAPDNLPVLLVDRTRIRQVLLNLINNAIRFTDEGSILVRAYQANGEVAISVADTGVGIPPEEMACIFEEFGQAKGTIVSGRGGAGLGLAICRQFVRLHGGQIEAESVVGKGSTFRFRLPLPESGRARSRLSYYAPEGWSPPVPENPMGKTAIVIGPDADAVAALARAIPGFRTFPVDSLQAMAGKVDEEHPRGIVLMCDPLVPDTITASDIWEAAGRSDLPVIRCESPMEGLVERALGVAGYLVKPVERARLTEAIRRACPEPRSILVVDDDPGFVSLVGRIVGADLEGTRLRRAYSGQEALAVLAEERPDLVLLDLVMAEANGLAVIEAMRRDPRLASLPVIVTTGSSYGEEVARLRPGKVELLRCGEAGRAEMGSYVGALLDAASPDYSLPAPPPVRQADAGERR
ncbi:MAG: ATP-binding response regulator [Anaerolineae bacterium]